MNKNILWAAGAFAIMMSIALPQTQGRPDFTGTWVVDIVDRPERPGGGPGGGGRREGGRGGRGGAMAMFEKGQRIRITQTAARLTVTSTGESGEQTNTYALDGSESANTAGRGTLKSRTKWEGAALVTEGTRNMEGPMGAMTLKTREVRSLSDDGPTMTLRTTVETPRGQRTTTVTFVKATN
jgi:hypothetical protein